MAEGLPPRSIRDVDHTHSVVDGSAAVSLDAVLGTPAEWRDRETIHPAIIGPDCVIREFVRVHGGCDRPTEVGPRTLLMAGSHIGHDAILGPDCEVAPNAVVGGHCTIGARVRIGMGATIVPFIEIGDDVRIGAGAVVTRDVPAGETWIGNPARRLHKWGAS